MSLRRLFTTLAIAGVACAGAASAQKAQPRLQQAIGNTPRVVLRGTVHPLTATLRDVGPATPQTMVAGMTLYFSMTAEQQQQVKTLLAQQQMPGSPLYHKWLTPQQFASEFGLAASDIAAVNGWLEREGFQVLEATPLHIRFSGSVAQVEDAFATRMDLFSDQGQTRLANATAISVPSALAGVVSTVRGLNEFRPQPRVVGSHLARRSPEAGADYSAGAGNNFLAPADFATIYDVTALYNAGYTGAGQKIAIVGQSSVQITDISNFRSAAGLSATLPEIFLIPNTGSNAASPKDEEESELDLEWSGSIAKNASVEFVYVGNNTNASVFDALQYAIENDVAPVVSISYGACEEEWSTADVGTLDGWLQQANSQGQTVIASSGDTGAADCDGSATQNGVVTEASQGLSVDLPASSPYVTGIGGTKFYADTTNPGQYWNSSNGADGGSALSYIPEEVWNDTSSFNGLDAGGGGLSILFSKPSWQTGYGVPADGARDVPDISLNASPEHDGYLYCSSAADSSSCSSGFVDSNGYVNVAGGTSFGAPAFAGILALLNQRMQAAGGATGQGNLNPAIYSAAAANYGSAFHDVTVGNNEVPCAAGSKNCGASGEIGYPATPGYDLASGWGSLDVYNFASAFVSLSAPTVAATTTSLTASVPTPTVGSQVTFTAVVSPSAGTNMPSGSVQFVVDGANSGSPVAVSPGNSVAANTVTVQAVFSTTFTTAGTHTVKAVYSGDSSYASSSGTLTMIVGATSSGSSSFALAASNLTVAQGSSGVSTVTVTPAGGFTGDVSFTVQAPAALQNACFSAQSADVTGGAATVSLTVYTSERSCQTISGASRLGAGPLERAVPQGPFGGAGGLAEGGAAFGSLLLLGFPALRRRKGIWVLLVLAGSMAGWMGCGSSSSGNAVGTVSAPTGTYTITVTGTEAADKLTSTTTFTLTIN